MSVPRTYLTIQFAQYLSELFIFENENFSCVDIPIEITLVVVSIPGKVDQLTLWWLHFKSPTIFFNVSFSRDRFRIQRHDESMEIES